MDGERNTNGEQVAAGYHRCPCGVLNQVEVVVRQDMPEDDRRAAQIQHRLCGRCFTEFTCPSCQSLNRVDASFVYHDAYRGHFVLVLPDSFRGRELLEREAMISLLRSSNQPIEPYMLQFELVYESEGLANLLFVDAVKTEEKAWASEGATQVEAQETESANPLVEAKEPYEISRLRADLEERELALLDRKNALDRRSTELQDRAKFIEDAQKQLIVERKGRSSRSQSMEPEKTQKVGRGDILTSAPSMDDDELDSPLPILKSVSGVFDNDDLIGDTMDIDAGHTQVIAMPKDEGMDMSIDRALDQLTNPRDHQDTRTFTPVPTEENPVSTKFENSMEDWKKKGGVLKIISGKELRFLACIPDDKRSELEADDLRALLQLHKMPSFALISLTLATSKTLSGEQGTPYSLFFNVEDSNDRIVLDRLADGFRFHFEMYDANYTLYKVRALAAPLSTNVRLIVAMAVDACRVILPAMRSFSTAVRDFEKDELGRLGRSHMLAFEFKDKQLDRIDSITGLILALHVCERFSEAEGEEYLIAVRSYPFDRWHSRRLKVIRRAIELGWWPGVQLSRIAVSEGIAKNLKSLVQTCMGNFRGFVKKGAIELTSSMQKENWSELKRQDLMDVAGVIVSSDAMLSESHNRSPTEPELVSNDSKLSAIVGWSEKKNLDSVESISRALPSLSIQECPKGFAAFVSLGSMAVPALKIFLNCPTFHLRHGAALALCTLGDEGGVDSICEELMYGRGELWREYAFALGQVGKSSIMPIVARVARAREVGEFKAVWAMAYIIGNDGRGPVSTLSVGDDVEVSKVALAALELEMEMQKGKVDIDRLLELREFTDAFYESLLKGGAVVTGRQEYSEPAMLIESSDLIDESDLL